MEPDRYKQNHVSYIAGLFCLIVSIGLLALSLYVFPNLILGWHYDIPDFIVDFTTMMEEQYNFSSNSATWFIFIMLDLPAVLLFIIADVLSNKIDSQIYGLNRSSANAPSKKTRSSANPSPSGGESKGLVLRMIMVIAVVFIVAEFFQWAIS